MTRSRESQVLKNLKTSYGHLVNSAFPNRYFGKRHCIEFQKFEWLQLINSVTLRKLLLFCLLSFCCPDTIRVWCDCRRKCTSPNTLSIQVPVFSCLGQSLPDLNQVTASSSTGGPMLLVPPRGSPHRGTSYPPPSPPLRRAPAISRNPPLLKTRNVASASSATFVTSCELDVPVVIAGQSVSN